MILSVHSEHPGVLPWLPLVSCICAIVNLICTSALEESASPYMYSTDQNILFASLNDLFPELMKTKNGS